VLRLLSFLFLPRQSTVFYLDDEAPQIACYSGYLTCIVALCHITISSLYDDEVFSHSGATIHWEYQSAQWARWRLYLFLMFYIIREK